MTAQVALPHYFLGALQILMTFKVHLNILDAPSLTHAVALAEFIPAIVL